jgi:serine/threonine protein kinase
VKLIRGRREVELAGLRRLKQRVPDHAHLVPIEDVGSAGEWLYCLMPLADNATTTPNALGTDEYEPLTLGVHLARSGRIPSRETAALGAELASALVHLHRHGVTHGDVKPGNILRRDGRWCLADYGLAGDVSDPRPRGCTPPYSPSEGAGTTRADQYALGVVLLQAVTGWEILAKDLDDFGATLARRMEWLRELDEPGATELAAVIEKALAMLWTDPPAMRDCEIALRRIAAPAAEVRPAASSRRRVAVAALILLLVIVLGAAAAATWDSLRARPLAILAADFYRAGSAEERLTTASRLAVGDRLFFEITPTEDAYLYILNEDDQGRSHLLFPAPGLDRQNPIPGGESTRLPGSVRGVQEKWVVDSPATIERFVVLAFLERQPELEERLASLPVAGESSGSAELSARAAGAVLRGTGGRDSSSTTGVTGTRLAQVVAPYEEGPRVGATGTVALQFVFAHGRTAKD